MLDPASQSVEASHLCQIRCTKPAAAWEPGFPEEADALFRERVEPEVEIIEEKVRDEASLEELAWGTARHGATPATFGVLIGTASDLPTLTGAAAGGLPILGTAGVKALLDRRDKLTDPGQPIVLLLPGR